MLHSSLPVSSRLFMVMFFAISLSTSAASEQNISTEQQPDPYELLVEDFCNDLSKTSIPEEFNLNKLIDKVNQVVQAHENESQRLILKIMKENPGISQTKAQDRFYLKVYEELYDSCPSFQLLTHAAFGKNSGQNPALEAISHDVTVFLAYYFDGTYQEHMNALLAELDSIFEQNEALINEHFEGGINNSTFQAQVAEYLLVRNKAFAKLTVLKVIQKPQ